MKCWNRVLILVGTFGVCGALMPVVSATEPAQKAAPNRQQIAFFETEIRPLLAENCYQCHGPDKQKGGLRLDGLGAMLGGGESGSPAVVPGQPAESLLIEAVNWQSYEMPPSGKLGDQQIAALTKWVEMGAPWPGGHGGGSGQPTRTVEKITDEDRSWWAFQPVRDPAVPTLVDDKWCLNEVDHFVLRELRERGLTPSPEADPATLIRRVTYDLTGLPPTPEETTAFVNDPSPDAYERLVERLLESPRYGERWARHWLDLVRYADSDGYKQDAFRPDAWRYRDYVIQSFNDDNPYDRFVMEQLAGDEIAPHDAEALVATGYLRHWIYEYNQRDCRTQWDVILTDVTDVTGEVFLGMGLGCARCHDHKFDPILQKDYFALRAFFAAILPRDDIPAADGDEFTAYQERLAVWEEKTAEIRAEIDAILHPYRRNATHRAVEKFPPDIREFLKRPETEWSPLERQLADLVQRQVVREQEAARSKLNKEEKDRVQALEKELERYADLKPQPLPSAMTVSDVGPVAPTVTIPDKAGLGEIAPAFLTVLGEPPVEVMPPADLASTGRRTALAKWIADSGNPLSTRVIVNRVWQQHFGRGIVATTSDFGHLGELPSHPELLDWLTSRFLENGWRLKPLHRTIVLSATYRQASIAEGAKGQWDRGTKSDLDPHPATDPENRLLWRQNVRRLDAEQVRDAILAVTGELDLHAGGPPVTATTPRRSVFTKVMRNSPDPLIAAFDGAEGFASTAQRNVTTTPTQALLLVNGGWAYQRAKALAARVESQSEDPVRYAYRLCYGRRPTNDEHKAATEFLRALGDVEPGGSASQALVDFCHVLLNSNEFVYVD